MEKVDNGCNSFIEMNLDDTFEVEDTHTLPVKEIKNSQGDSTQETIEETVLEGIVPVTVDTCQTDMVQFDSNKGKICNIRN